MKLLETHGKILKDFHTGDINKETLKKRLIKEIGNTGVGTPSTLNLLNKSYEMVSGEFEARDVPDTKDHIITPVDDQTERYYKYCNIFDKVYDSISGDKSMGISFN